MIGVIEPDDQCSIDGHETDRQQNNMEIKGRNMGYKKNSGLIWLPLVIAAAGAGNAVAQETCNGVQSAVSGKIFNNGQVDGSPFGTLGVVALKGDFGKMKCGIAGVVQQELPPPALPNFHHTISCDDEVVLPTGQVVHSQLTFDTNGYFTDPYVHPLPFEEVSVPIAGTGRGVFTYATGGALSISGTLDTVTGTIDMEFSGSVCIDPSAFPAS